MIVDKREKNSLVVAELIEKRCSIELKHLKIADYIIKDIAIERKTIDDFISSMLNKRLLRQLQEIKQYPKQLLIIEGSKEKELYSDLNERIHANSIRGMLLSIIFKFKIPILFTKDYKDTANFLILLEKRQERSSKKISLKVKKKASSLKEQKKLVLESFPGIGPVTSEKLLKNFKSLKEIFNLNEEKLKEAGLNEKKAKKFIEIVECSN